MDNKPDCKNYFPPSAGYFGFKCSEEPVGFRALFSICGIADPLIQEGRVFFSGRKKDLEGIIFRNAGNCEGWRNPYPILPIH